MASFSGISQMTASLPLIWDVSACMYIYILPKKNNKSQKQNNKKPTVTEQRTN